ncbi:hypothetical protein HDA45_006567 [Amycolatopsis umgeniensis]|uniref:Uncharacterized protein n=1 Tax=Amycolatopsis umgeniensis TaxID=336628 RepID=A0A841BBZ0_9PSEU|nr:hypothetical protein [Amycolatopsis umgeniensis]
MYAVSVVVHLAIAGSTTAAVATTSLISNGLIAFGMGAAAPVVVKKVAGYALQSLPSAEDSPQRGERGSSDGS